MAGVFDVFVLSGVERVAWSVMSKECVVYGEVQLVSSAVWSAGMRAGWCRSRGLGPNEIGQNVTRVLLLAGCDRSIAR